MATLILFNKPYGVLSQFSDAENRPTLAEYIKLPHVYPAGRLDHDSEGLLLLTDDGDLQHRITHPSHKLPKTYWVQVEGAPNSYALTKLRQGVALNDGITEAAEVKLIPTPKLWERDPPIRSRANIPTQWLELTITEGRNRQIRRMTAAVDHPTLRLVRVKIGNWTLEGIEPGKYKTETVHLPQTPGAKPSNVKTRSAPPLTRPQKTQTTGKKPERNNSERKSTPTAKNSTTKPKTTHTTIVIQKPKSKPIDTK